MFIVTKEGYFFHTEEEMYRQADVDIFTNQDEATAEVMAICNVTDVDEVCEPFMLTKEGYFDDRGFFTAFEDEEGYNGDPIEWLNNFIL